MFRGRFGFDLDGRLRVACRGSRRPRKKPGTKVTAEAQVANTLAA